MGSAFLCASLGIVPTVRHADYIGAWLEVLREDNRAIFRAASMASKAADWLLARHEEASSARGEVGRSDAEPGPSALSAGGLSGTNLSGKRQSPPSGSEWASTGLTDADHFEQREGSDVQ